MERLSPLSYAFLAAEDVDPATSLVIGSVAVLDGPAPSLGDLRDHVRSRLDRAPRYRERLQRSFLDLRAPGWVRDRAFDVGQHVHAFSAEPPGGRDELAEVVGTLMSQRMDRYQALWDCWLVDGLEGGQWALVARVHHALADGISGTALLSVLYDLDAAPITQVAAPRPASRPAVPGPSGMVSTVVRGSLAILGSLRPVSATPLTGRLGPDRDYAWAEVSLSEGRAAAHHFGVTLNDVVLACVAGAFRDLLLVQDVEPGKHALRTLVPVSSRPPGADGHPDNQVTLLLPELPVDIADPVARLHEVHARVAILRAVHEPEAGELVQVVARRLPFAVVARAERWGLRLPQRQVATVATNVPGPRERLTCLGRPVVALLPYVPLADRVRVGVAILSYQDTIAFGVTGDTDASLEISVLAESLAGAWAELYDACP